MQLFGCQKSHNTKEEREEEGNTPKGVYSVIKFNRKKKIHTMLKISQWAVSSLSENMFIRRTEKKKTRLKNAVLPHSQPSVKFCCCVC